MGFDDMLGDDHRRHRGLRKHDDDHHHGHNHHDRDDKPHSYRPRDDDYEDGRYSHRRHDHDGDVDLERLVHLMLANKRLLLAAALVIVAAIVLAIIFLLPLLGTALEHLDKSGVKGVAERVLQESGSGK